ncbi:MAG TPA: site-specific integrase, partial [Salinarimonas sp.]|nr:site-specific integrase [Salinarimonas sp.]
LTKGTPLTSAWEALLAAAGSQPYRQGIKRLAHFCSASGIAPERVDCETLRDLHEALVDECIVKNPRAIIKHTIAVWNMMGRRVPGWPTTVLSSPFATEPHALPLSAFPQTFQDDVARWQARMTDPDPLDLEAPLRALRPATLKGYHMIFRRFASALVRQGIVPLEAMTGLHVFFQGRHFREGLRYFLRRNDPAGAAETAKIAGMLGKVARHYVRVDEASEREIKAVLRRLEPGVVRGMGRRNRERLDQFDAPEAVRAILSFPEAEAARARARRSPGRRARGMERALAVRLLIDTGLRIGNLRQIRFDSLRRIGSTTYLRVPGAQVKNGVELEHVLPAGTVVLIDEFVHEHRGHLPGSQGPYLFPGQDGGPKSDGAMRACVSEPIRKHTGLTMSPHLFRHVIAKIVVERDPTLYVAVSRHLGHKSINTTLGSYLGTETRAASRHLHRILDTAREEV